MIIFPMAGLSSRFTKAGYEQPKWMLPLADRPLLDWSLLSFASFFDQEKFLIVFLDRPGVGAFVERRVAELKIANPVLVPLSAPTAGQAETVHLGLNRAGLPDSEDVTIFNIDTIRPGYARSPLLDSSDGWLECFKGDGDHWSFVRESSGNPHRADEVVEKKRISDNCCTGIYWFKSARDFEAAYQAEAANPKASELFVAPLYQRLIEDNKRVSFDVIADKDIFFSGTPAEYEHAKTQQNQLRESFKEYL